MVRVVRGEVGHGYCQCFLSSPHFSLTAYTINILQVLLHFVIILHSPPTLSTL